MFPPSQTPYGYNTFIRSYIYATPSHDQREVHTMSAGEDEGDSQAIIPTAIIVNLAISWHWGLASATG